MDAIDFFYNEFIEFCERNNLVEAYNKNLPTSTSYKYCYNISHKLFILSVLSKQIFNETLYWANTSEGRDFWSNIHNLWLSYWETIILKKFKKVCKSLDVTTFKFVEDDVKINYPFLRKIDIGDKIILTYIKRDLYEDIVNSKAPVTYELLLDKDLIHVSDSLSQILINFPRESLLIQNLYSLKDIDYLNLEIDGKVSYLPIDKTLRKGFDPNKAYIDKNKKITTIGRVIRKFDNWKEYTNEREIEKLSNYFSTIFSNVTVEILGPKQVKDVYLEKNYCSIKKGTTSTLHNSCMRHEECQSYFDFYKAAKTKIVVVYDKYHKICGRALLWKINNSLYFLDRIYAANPALYTKIVFEVKKMVNIDYYKIDKQYYSAKTNNVTHAPNYIIHRKELINYSGKFPYVDSFYYFDKTTGTLSTTTNNLLILHSTTGSYSGTYQI